MAAVKDRLPATLLVLRFLVFGFFLFWTLEKFVNPERAAGIYRMAYSVRPGDALVVLMGTLELALILAFVVGFQKRWVRAILLGIMTVAAMAPARFYPTPFDDHILLYYAAIPTLAIVFMLYYLRDYDTIWTLGERQTAGVRPHSADDPRVPFCLLLTRLAVFFVLFMWNMDKFFHPLQTSRIFAGFYNVGGEDPLLGLNQLSYEVVYVIGVLQLLLILAFVLGLAKRYVYGAVFLLHSVSAFAPWDRFLSPFSSHTLLFLAGVTMLGGCFALYCLRDRDVLWTFSKGRWAPSVGRASMTGALSFRNRPVKVGAILAAIAAVFVIGVNASEWRYERTQGPARVVELQQRYVPSELLLSLEPEMNLAKWTPMWRSTDCTFSNPTIENCWQLHFIVWVPSVPGNVMRGRRQVEAAWILDADTMEFRPDRNGRRFFEARSEASSL